MADIATEKEAQSNIDSEQQISKAEFGKRKAGNFEYTPDLRKSYQESADIIAAQISEYKESGGELSNAQRRFLELYQKNPKNLLDTANGWITTHLVLEHEMFIISAIMKRDLWMLLKTRGEQPTPKTSVTISKDIFEQGFLNRWGKIIIKSPLIIPAAIRKVYKSAITNNTREITIQLNNLLTVDIESLSDAEKKYIQYLSSSVDRTELTDFLLKGAHSQQEFYKSLGIDPAVLKDSPTAWYRFKYYYKYNPLLSNQPITPEETQQGLGTSWERFRTEQVRKIVEEEFGGRIPRDKKARLQLFSRAQQATIEHFANKQLLSAIDNPKNQTSISTMEERARKLKDTDELKTWKKKLRKKKQRLNSQITEVNAIIDKKRDEISKKRENIDGSSTEDTEDIDIKETQLDNYNDLITTLTYRLEQIKLEYENKLENQNLTDKEKERIEREKQNRLKAINKIIDKIRNSRDNLQKQIDIQKETEELTTQLQEYERKKTNLERNHDMLTQYLEELNEINAQQTAAQLEMIATSLGRYGTIISDVFNNNEVQVQTLIDSTKADRQHTRFNSEFEKGEEIGYLATLDHIFQYTNTEDPKQALQYAQKILPKETLKILIENYFDISSKADLSAVFQEMQQREITSSEYTRLFMDIMEYIENKGLKEIGVYI